MCTEECGRLQPPDESELIGAFEIVIRDAFAFLGPERDLLPSSLSTFDVADGYRSPVAPADATFPFLAVIEFTGSNRPVRLSYGHRDYHLDLEIGANGSGFHPLASWLDVLEIPHEGHEDSGVASPTALARHSRRLATALRRHLDQIISTDQRAIDRLPAQAAHSAPRVNRTRDRAHTAFTEGDYEAYVELLEPFENALTVTERRKLEFARAKRKAA
ncbi:MAG: hypothetical protein ACR2OI_06925 [Acidimicrobiia bacterium]